MKGLESCNTAELKGWTGLRLLRQDSREAWRLTGERRGGAQALLRWW